MTPLNGEHALIPHLWSWQLVGAMVITFIVQGATIGAYAARLAGVQTGRIATSISLFNLFGTAARLANLFSVVLVAPLGDRASIAISKLLKVHDIAGAAAFQDNYGWQLRFMVLGGTLGMIGFSFFLPMFTFMFRRGIRSFERRHDLLGALAQLVTPRVIGDIFRSIRFPPWSELRGFSTKSIPRRLLIFNVVVTGVYAIGVAASYYASILDIEAARTAVSLSGIVNGVGTIAFTLFVDPTSALITDQAIKGERPIENVRSMVFFLAVTAIVGTLLSQLILWPSAKIIEFVAHFFTHLHG